MDKVIIDRVDVSGCVRLAIDNISCDLGGECKGWDNCYYKQLQRLKHQYADVLKLAKENADSNEYCLQELEQENKRLIARLRPLEDSYFNGLSSIEIAELAKKSIRITAENRKLEDALQEIRDIISEPCIVDENCQTCNSGCMQKDILDKINSVIGAE